MSAATVDRITALPGVAEAVDAARQACTQLRRHPALRRRAAEARAEAAVRAAGSSAALDGARLPLELVRDVARGVRQPPDDAVGRTVQAALRVVAEAERLAASWSYGPPAAGAGALVRLHLAAAAGLVDDDALGRPRRDGEQPLDGANPPAPAGAALAARLDGITALLRAPASSPAVVVAALLHAEIATVRPFLAGNGLVARGLARAVVVARGLDPSGVAVWEAGLVAAAPGAAEALDGYRGGGADGVAAWVRSWCSAVVDGAGEGAAVCDAVLAGRLP